VSAVDGGATDAAHAAAALRVGDDTNVGSLQGGGQRVGRACASPSSDGACLSSEVSGGQGNGLNVAVVAEGRAQSQGGDVVGESTAGAAVLWVVSDARQGACLATTEAVGRSSPDTVAA